MSYDTYKATEPTIYQEEHYYVRKLRARLESFGSRWPRVVHLYEKYGDSAFAAFLCDARIAEPEADRFFSAKDFDRVVLTAAGEAWEAENP